jgi:predicted site-specific integrase-resolvase
MSDALPDDRSWIEDGFLETTEAAHVLGVDADQIRRWCRAEFIRNTKDPISRRLLVSSSDIRAIAEYCNGAAPTTNIVRRLAGSNDSS